jgi:hypothetical protein
LITGLSRPLETSSTGRFADGQFERLTGLINLRQGTVEEKAVVDVVTGQEYDVLVEYTNTAAPASDENGAQRLAQPALMKGVVSTCLHFRRDYSLIAE